MLLRFEMADFADEDDDRLATDETLLAVLAQDLPDPPRAREGPLTGDQFYRRWSKELDQDRRLYLAATETPEQRDRRLAASEAYRARLAAKAEEEARAARETKRRKWLRRMRPEAIAAREDRNRRATAMEEMVRQYRANAWRAGPQHRAWVVKLDAMATTLQEAGFARTAEQLRHERQHLGELPYISVQLPPGIPDELVRQISEAIRPPAPHEVAAPSPPRA